MRTAIISAKQFRKTFIMLRQPALVLGGIADMEDIRRDWKSQRDLAKSHSTLGARVNLATEADWGIYASVNQDFIGSDNVRYQAIIYTWDYYSSLSLKQR